MRHIERRTQTGNIKTERARARETETEIDSEREKVSISCIGNYSQLMSGNLGGRQ